MKLLSAALCCIAVITSITVCAQNFDGYFPAFKVNNPVIHWDAPTNLAASLWVYKVVPQRFSVKALNNLLKLGGYTNRLTESSGLALNDTANSCSLVIEPSQGYIRYWNGYAPANHWDKTNHLWESVSGVPQKKDLERLGLNFLKQFEINKEDLASDDNGYLIRHGCDVTRGYFDRRRNKYVENEVTARGIYFIRKINGVSFTGIGLSGGSFIQFGNQKKVSEFTLIWRNLQPYERYMLKNQDEITQSILGGNARLTLKNVVNAANVKSLVITKITPYYYGTDDSTKQEFCYPFAEIAATADMGTNKIGIGLICPILSTNRIE